MSPDGPPDEITPLLPSQGITSLGALDDRSIGVPVEETATSNSDLGSDSLQVTVGAEPDSDQTERSWTGLPRWLGWIPLLALFLGISTVNIDSSFMMTAYLNIGSELGDQQHAAWLLQAYQIGVIASRPFYSFSADSRGRMKPLMASYCFFASGVMLCGMSNSFWVLASVVHLPVPLLATSRLVVGIGSAGMWMLVSVILNDWVDLSKRATWESVIKVAVVAGQVVGDLLGGPFEEYHGWQSAFTFPFVLAFLSSTTVWVKLRRTPVNELVPARLGQVDLQTSTLSWNFAVGGLLLLMCAACLCLVPQFVSTEASWYQPYTYLVVSCLTISSLGFVCHQCKTQNEALVDFRLICQSPFWQIFLATIFREGAIAGLLFLIPWYSAATGKEALSRTSLMVGHSLGIFAGGLVANASLVKWKALKYIYITFEIVCALAAFMMISRLRYTDSLWEACAYVFAFALGSSAASATFLVLLVQVTEANRQARMYGSKMLVTDIAVLSSISVLNSVLPGQLGRYMRSNLTSRLPSGSIEELIKSCKSSLNCMDGLNPEIQHAIQVSLKQACIIVLILLIVCTSLSAGCGVLSKDIKLHEGRSGGLARPLGMTAQEGRDDEEVQHRTNRLESRSV